MTAALTAADIFRAAVLLEERGARFYGEAASRFSGEEGRLFAGLASMELNHAERFRSILKDTGPEGDIDGEKVQYLEALTGGRIFTAETEWDEGDGCEEILKKAIAVEKNAVFFYTAVKETLLAGMDAEAVDRLIREEVSHFEFLSAALLKRRRGGGGE
ncbi:MAG: ferritin family protein [Synergistaceae bacterium]|nr:ferritin family protein [Synergistaceae bacterium]